jgi:hypothetical protein
VGHSIGVDARLINLLETGSWCREQDLNLHAFRHWILSPARLPIPPSRQLGKTEYISQLTRNHRSPSIRGRNLTKIRGMFLKNSR